MDGAAYEAERLARIASNKKRLAELVPAAAVLQQNGTPPPPRQRRPRTSPDVPPRSGSARLRGEPAPEVELDEHDALVEPLRAGEKLQGFTVCHCCRQPSQKYKAECTSETCSLIWCVDCLNNKEGVDAHVANDSGSWLCPLCEGGVGHCLCSMCRRKAGRAALGPLWPVARAQGFTSVRAYMAANGMQ